MGVRKSGAGVATDRAEVGERRLTELNPQLAEKNLAKTELVPYLDADGKKLFGVLYYPSNYEKGKSIPRFSICTNSFSTTRSDDSFIGTDARVHNPVL